MAIDLGHTIVIANPAAHSGGAAAYADYLQNYLQDNPELTQDFSFLRTSMSGDAERIAAASISAGAQTVIALGGDGIINETVNGLMRIPADVRPTLALIPIGTGNDFARTCSLEWGSAQIGIEQLLSGTKRTVDVGLVNEHYFVQSLSFGLDAAIAHDTSKHQQESPGASRGHYVTSGLKLLSKSSRGWHVKAQLDGQTIDFQELIFAFQMGPTYGGGFKICPDANPVDGQLHCCYNVSMPRVLHALALFARARFGRHTNSPVLAFKQVKQAILDFDEEPPAQTDGEQLHGTHFEISVVPQALKVIVGDVSW